MKSLKNIFCFITGKLFRRGFTLLEILIAVITLGVVASLALSNYRTIMEQSYCNTAQRNLIAIRLAAEIHLTKTGTWNISGTTLTNINNDLRLNINDPKFIYTYESPPFSPNLASATRTGGPTYTLWVDVNPVSSTNPSINPAFCTNVIPPP